MAARGREGRARLRAARDLQTAGSAASAGLHGRGATVQGVSSDRLAARLRPCRVRAWRVLGIPLVGAARGEAEGEEESPELLLARAARDSMKRRLGARGCPCTQREDAARGCQWTQGQDAARVLADCRAQRCPCRTAGRSVARGGLQGAAMADCRAQRCPSRTAEHGVDAEGGRGPCLPVGHRDVARQDGACPWSGRVRGSPRRSEGTARSAGLFACKHTARTHAHMQGAQTRIHTHLKTMESRL